MAVVSSKDVAAVERALGTLFPTSFVTFITTHGPVFSPGILDLIVDAQESGEAEFSGWDVAEFLSPSEIQSTHSMYSDAGMDASLIPFAQDSAGNVFGFRRIVADTRPDDGPVLFFDHDFCAVRVEAESFDHWLERFLQLRSS